MSLDQLACRSTGSTPRPIIFTLRLSKSGFIRAIAPSSVVHTGVKSFGWENRIPHESPSHLWNRIGPSVVSASKSGAAWPMASGPFIISLPELSFEDQPVRSPDEQLTHRTSSMRSDPPGCDTLTLVRNPVPPEQPWPSAHHKRN